MTKINHLEIYRHLNKSNCRECGVPTCMAFALAVVNGNKGITDCPHIDRNTAEELDAAVVKRDRDKDFQAAIGPLRESVSGVDFSKTAQGLGAETVNERLRITCLGKDFFIDKKGRLESVVHVNEWIMMPLYKYIITGGSRPLSGKWVSFEELKKAATMAQYFDRRCEEPLRQLAESHTEIFFDLLNIFGGKQVEGFSADHAVIIHPLPKVPFLILYWKPEEQFESKLKVLLDSTSDSYLDAHSIYVLGRGIVEMFKKILSKHEEILPKILSL
jgi:hypothetical protein